MCRLTSETAADSVANVEVLLESSRLRMLDFRLPAGKRVEVEHTVPTVRWEVLDPNLPTAWPMFFKGCSRHWVENTGAEERREIVFEILGPPEKSEDEVRSLMNAAKYPTLIGTELMLENRYCRLVELKRPPGTTRPSEFHQHVLDYGMVFLHGSILKIWQPQEKDQQEAEEVEEVHFKDAHSIYKTIERGGFDEEGHPHRGWAAHNVTNCQNDRWLRVYHVELK